MKTLGIEIKGNCAIFCAIEYKQGVTDLTGKMKKLELANDEDSQEIKEFIDVVHAYFDKMQFDRIGIIKRSKSLKAKFPPSPISFKVEGLIQTYLDIDMEFIAPQTLRAFYKKNDFDFSPKHAYQKSAAELAYYLLEK